jgi:serine phosphatase RsbU (regulator of sigma subunit)
VLLFAEGDPVEHFSILLEGQVEIIRSLGAPEERLLAAVGSGEFLGEMSVFQAQPRRTAAALARVQTRSLHIPTSDFLALLQRRPKLAIHILQELTERISNNEAVNIRNLQEQNRRLEQAYRELQAAQALLIEKEKLEHELALARRIQEQTLPAVLPDLPGWWLNACWLPAHQVSGDFYDVCVHHDTELRFLIADVSGKGVPAALVMATTRAILHTLMAHVDAPGALLAAANDLLLAEMPQNMFVACFYATLELSTGRLRFANAGQNLPYHLAAAGLLPLQAVGFPLGLVPGADYPEGQTVLQPGDGLLLYSDGLVEAHNEARQMFGNVRLATFLTTRPNPLSDLHGLLDEVRRFTAPSDAQEDDITLFCIHRYS